MNILKLIDKKLKYLNKQIIINGWIKNIRINSNIIFIDLNDGSTIKDIQIIVKSNIYNFNNISKLNKGSSISVNGILIKSNNNDIEVISNNINIIGIIHNKNYPMLSKYLTIEYLRKFFHLRSRTRIFSSISRLRNFIFNKLNLFMHKKNIIWIPTPIITSIDTEGSGNLFKVSSLKIYENIKNLNPNIDFFAKESFLTVSSQLYLETYACSLSKVYSFGPVFRAENSNTTKHLSEFWMLEVEIAFKNINYLLKLAKKMLITIINEALNTLEEDIYFIHKFSNINTEYIYKTINNGFEEIEYSEIIKLLNSRKIDIKWGHDITSKYENIILDIFKKPIIIKNYPKEIKPFYMKINSDNKTVSCMDILVPHVGELIGGSEREYRIDNLIYSIKKKGINIKNYDWYLDLRRYGTVPHSGFGLGFERLLLYITGIKNIKDIIPFPRYPKNIDM